MRASHCSISAAVTWEPRDLMSVETIPPGRELLDDLDADQAMVERSLRNIARANRWFGGVAAARFGLGRLLRTCPRRATLLDVGTGLGDVPRALVRAARAGGITLRPVGLERHPAVARLARREGLPTVLADAVTLPLRDRAVDLVLVSQVAHHLAAADLVALVTEASRVARVGVILADLRPSRLAVLGFRLAARLLRFDQATRRDGVISLRRGFTVAGLRNLLASGGITARVVARPWARVVAVWSTAG